MICSIANKSIRPLASFVVFLAKLILDCRHSLSYASHFLLGARVGREYSLKPTLKLFPAFLYFLYFFIIMKLILLYNIFDALPRLGLFCLFTPLTFTAFLPPKC